MIMPLLGGREPYEALKEINLGVKVLLLSGYRFNFVIIHQFALLSP